MTTTHQTKTAAIAVKQHHSKVTHRAVHGVYPAHQEAIRALGGEPVEPDGKGHWGRVWRVPVAMLEQAQAVVQPQVPESVKTLESQLKEILERTRIEAFTARTKLEQEQIRIVREHMSTHPVVSDDDEYSGHFMLGFHVCYGSPIGVCVYDADDLNCDTCLFCHDPQERK